MSRASTTSPFLCMCDTDSWILWASKTDVLELQDELHTERRSVNDDIPLPDQTTCYVPQPIQRKQYNAVLDRINRASKNTGGFSSWNS